MEAQKNGGKGLKWEFEFMDVFMLCIWKKPLRIVVG